MSNKFIFVICLLMSIFFNGCATLNTTTNGTSNIEIGGHVGYGFSK